MFLGDAAGLLRKMTSKAVLRRAFRYAQKDRLKEWFYDPFELEWAMKNETSIINELVEELKDPLRYQSRPAYAYFTPKTDLCFRRMIYIPFKDLVVRYAFAIVAADLVDPDLSAHCFANRRDRRGESGAFLQDFAATAWPSFCEWQRNSRNEGSFPTLLRTDISAFYDAVSHKYLAADIAESLDIAPNSKLMKVFLILLRTPVLSYSQVTRKQRRPETMHQGLCIGNTTDGFFANVYLKSIDREMERIEDIDFGRYNDDMRVFAKDRAAAKRAMLALQERLLTKGLNLNSSKTRFAKGEVEIDELRSKAYEGNEYAGEDQDSIVVRPAITDKPFDEFDTDFEIGQALGNEGKDAKDFCHFLAKRLTLVERQPGHVEMLETILKNWHGSAKHAAWLLVESIVHEKCPNKTRQVAENILLGCLRDPEVTSYAKYRLLHHLVRRRLSQTSSSYRYSAQLKTESVRNIMSLLPRFLAETAFELNIIALYAMQSFGSKYDDLEMSVNEHACKPVPLPIKNALSIARASAKSRPLPALVSVGADGNEFEDNY